MARMPPPRPPTDPRPRRRMDTVSATALSRVYAAAYAAQPNLGIADTARRSAGRAAVIDFCALMEEEVPC